MINIFPCIFIITEKIISLYIWRALQFISSSGYRNLGRNMQFFVFFSLDINMISHACWIWVHISRKSNVSIDHNTSKPYQQCINNNRIPHVHREFDAGRVTTLWRDESRGNARAWSNNFDRAGFVFDSIVSSFEGLLEKGWWCIQDRIYFYAQSIELKINKYIYIPKSFHDLNSKLHS